MIEQNRLNNQLPNEINHAFSELKVLHYLRKAGIKKGFGYTSSSLFQLVFLLIFHHKNWFRLLESRKGDTLPGKDAVYRFLNHPRYAWRKFLLLFSAATIEKVRRLTSSKRITAFVIDDSMFERNRSKSVELLSRFHDHATHTFYKGFKMLTLGWTDGHTFLLVDFSLLSSSNKKAQINGISERIDKRTSGYKRRVEALQKAPEVIPIMIERALSMGIHASYVLMDSWFTHAPLIQVTVEKGLDVIGMVKPLKFFQNRRFSLNELYTKALRVHGKKGILKTIFVQLESGIPVKIVFVQHRSLKKEWLAILSTDCSLSEEEIIRIYGMRWDIELFFKSTKSLLKLSKEFQGRSYDLLVSHTTIVFSRYILLSWQHRVSKDPRTLGGLFYEFSDEVHELDWATVLKQLLQLLEDVIHKSNRKLTKWIKSQLQQWIASLPSYIKVYLPISGCES